MDKMGFETRVKNDLTFNELREANIKRLPQFKNGKGEAAHSSEDGSDWSLGEWMNAVTGEIGEAANIIKKIKRGDFSLEEAREELAKELADAVTYLDIVARRAGINLGRATIDKFNEVSDRVGSNVKLGVYTMPVVLCTSEEQDLDNLIEHLKK